VHPVGVVVAIDAGTTGVRSLAIDEAGRPVASAHRELTQHFPRPGWVEHDPEEIWQAVCSTLAAVRGRLDQPVAAIGVTNQRETVVAWDRRRDEPLHRAIVWQDRRGAERCVELVAGGHLDLVRRRTGLVLDPYFSGTKVEWLLGPGGVPTGPDLAVGTVDSWLLWRLSGGSVHATDASNACRTMLFDIRRLAWDEDLADLLHVPINCLAEVRPSSGRFGVTAARPGGLADGIPISGVAGDQQAALFGQACFTPGMTKNTYGTGSFVLMQVGDHCPDPVEGLLTTIAWVLDRPATTAYALEGAIFVTGAAVQWLRDGLGIIRDAAEVEALAGSVADSGGVYVVPAHAGLGSPWWDPQARGTVIGLTRGAGRAQLARAVVDAMAFQTRAVVEAMSAGCGHDLRCLQVDGGASVNDLLLQIQADQLGVPVARAAVAETTALGAAYLAGLAEGVWSTLDDLATRTTWDHRALPRDTGGSADAGYRQWLRAVERSRDWSGPADAT